MKRGVARVSVLNYFLPAAIILLLLAGYPVVRNILLGFQGRRGGFTLANYSRLFQNENFWSSILISLRWLLITVSGEMLIGLVFAILLNKKIKGNNIFRTIFMFPWIMPVVAGCVVWTWMYNGDMGIIHQLVYIITGKDVTFLSNPDTTLYWLAVVYFWKRSSFCMLMYLGGLQGISEDIYDACKVDGVSPLKQIVRITIPLMFPIIRALLLMNIISSLNQFTIVYSMTAGGPARSTELIQLFIYSTGIAGYQYNFGGAASTIFMIFVLITAMVYINATEKVEEDIY
jgi:multiple sugar transport system permease protein